MGFAGARNWRKTKTLSNFLVLNRVSRCRSHPGTARRDRQEGGCGTLGSEGTMQRLIAGGAGTGYPDGLHICGAPNTSGGTASITSPTDQTPDSPPPPPLIGTCGTRPDQHHMGNAHPSPGRHADVRPGWRADSRTLVAH